MKFQDDISNMNTYIHKYIRTSRNQYVSHFFKVGGIKMTLRSHIQAVTEDDSLEDSPQGSTWVTMKTPQDPRNGQLHDPTIYLVLEWKESDHKPTWDEISHLGSDPKRYWSQWDRLKMINGVLYREWYESQGGSL